MTSADPQTVCLECGAPLPPDASHCTECGAGSAALPEFDGNRETPPSVDQGETEEERREMFESVEGADGGATSEELEAMSAEPETDEVEAVTTEELDSASAEDGEDFDEDEVDAPQVPAGTWASTSVIDELAPRDDDTINTEIVGAPTESGDAHPRRARRDASESRTVERFEPGTAREAKKKKKDSPSNGSGKVRAGQLVEFPSKQPSSEKTAPRSSPKLKGEKPPAKKAKDAPEARPPAEPEVPPQPRWMASELLRAKPVVDPYAHVSRLVGLVAGGTGTAVSMLVGTEGSFALGVAILFATIAILSVTPLRFLFRGAGYAVLATLGLSASAFLRSEAAGDSVGLVLLGNTVLAAALLLRGVHYESSFARAGIALGLAVSISWFAVSGGFESMVVRDFDDLSWLAPLGKMLLVIALGLSVFSFVDDYSGSGASAWAVMLLGWLVLEAFLTIVVEFQEITSLSASAPDWILATAAAPLFAVVCAFGWMQIWAITPGLGIPVSSRRTPAARRDVP